ncbi:hypothetical protein [Arthrobacter sp. 35W]|uniref:hypothetical protein n=1 Tax=Arthrobacter sp. 35W TaxID=1132441 RepID=UPI000478B10D|nr:hypothetical protein [Arthrobacter sp. 35W]
MRVPIREDQPTGKKHKILAVFVLDLPKTGVVTIDFSNLRSQLTLLRVETIAFRGKRPKLLLETTDEALAVCNLRPAPFISGPLKPSKLGIKLCLGRG